MGTLKTATLLACAVLISACAAPRPPGPAPLTASANVAPTFEVPTRRERMVTLARQEWALFGSPMVRDLEQGGSRLEFAPGTAPTHELQGPMLARVLAYWYGVSRLPIVGHQGELRPWSAAFIAWLARAAGYGPDEFPATVLHWDYIEQFIRSPQAAPFVARDPALHAPEVGDLVCNARSDGRQPEFAGQVTDFSALRRGPYHCDLVVEHGPDHVQAIGGNVADTVAMTRMPLMPDGRLRTDEQRRWVVVLKHRSP